MRHNLAVAEAPNFAPLSVQQVEADPTQPPEVDRELRIATDTATWLAETLHGSMRTSFEFTHDGTDLRGEDGGSIDEIFDDAIIEARLITEQNPSMLFELRRRLIEREELNDMHKMLDGELPNTMVVLSDFPPELANAEEDVGGYNVSRQQTMMRIITLQANKIRVVSQSLDGSNPQALEAIGIATGQAFETGEKLSQRRYLDLSEEQQDQLADKLTKVHDDSLAQQFPGTQWHAGISQSPERNMVNTYDFVMAQQDLITLFTKEKLANPVGAERLRYKLAATAKARHERHLRSLSNQEADQIVPGIVNYSSVVSEQSVLSGQVLLRELDREGQRAAERGDTFSGCGGTVTSGSESSGGGLSTSEQLSELGYSRGSVGSDKFGSLKFKCPNGHTNIRPRDKLIDKCQHKGCSATVKC